MIEKIVEIGIDFLTIFGPFWPPTWGAPGGPTNQPQGSNESGFSAQVGSRGPNGPQAPSKVDFWSILIDFKSILGRFWFDFGIFWGSFGDD